MNLRSGTLWMELMTNTANGRDDEPKAQEKRAVGSGAGPRNRERGVRLGAPEHRATSEVDRRRTQLRSTRKANLVFVVRIIPVKSRQPNTVIDHPCQHVT